MMYDRRGMNRRWWWIYIVLRHDFPTDMMLMIRSVSIHGLTRVHLRLLWLTIMTCSTLHGSRIVPPHAVSRIHFIAFVDGRDRLRLLLDSIYFGAGFPSFVMMIMLNGIAIARISTIIPMLTSVIIERGYSIRSS